MPFTGAQFVADGGEELCHRLIGRERRGPDLFERAHAFLKMPTDPADEMEYAAKDHRCQEDDEMDGIVPRHLRRRRRRIPKEPRIGAERRDRGEGAERRDPPDRVHVGHHPRACGRLHLSGAALRND
jgi:hypothetical protein